MLNHAFGATPAENVVFKKWLSTFRAIVSNSNLSCLFARERNIFCSICCVIFGALLNFFVWGDAETKTERTVWKSAQTFRGLFFDATKRGIRFNFSSIIFLVRNARKTFHILRIIFMEENARYVEHFAGYFFMEQNAASALKGVGRILTNCCEI